MTGPSNFDDTQVQARPHRARDLIFEEIRAVASFWDHVRDDPELGPSEALDVLALWGHARRFESEGEQATQAEELDKLVQRDAERLIDYVLRNPVLTQWQEQVKELDETWEKVRDPFEMMDCEDWALDLFVNLDRYDLARYAIRKLLPKVSEQRRKDADIGTFSQAVADAEAFFDQRAEVIQAGVGWARELLLDYRPDLDEFDEPLWRTTLKYRRLEALVEEQDDTSRLGRIDPQTLPRIAFPRIVREPISTPWVWRSVPGRQAAMYSLAASAAGTGDRKSRMLLQELSPPKGKKGKVLLKIHEGQAGKLTIECRASEEDLAHCLVDIVFKKRDSEKEITRVSLTLDQQDADGVWVSRAEIDRPRGELKVGASIQLQPEGGS